MLKKGKTAFALLCILCLLAAAAGGSENSLRNIRSTIGRIEQGSFAMMGDIYLIPEDCSGYELMVSPNLPDGTLDGILPGLPAPETDESTGMLRYALEEETTRLIMDDAYCASISPDGALLWVIYCSRPYMVVQRGKTLVLMAQSSGRGVPDTDGGLQSILDYKLNITSEPVEGKTVWSPDGRYLFFNDTERWRSERMILNDPYILDTLTGDIILIESSGNPKTPRQETFHCVLDGCFSMDGKSFYWYSRSYTPDNSPAHFLMRYDLQSDRAETVCELKGALLDFCEISENRWFLLESAGGTVSLVRMTVSPDGIEQTEEPLPAFCDTAVFLPAVREKVLLSATPLSNSGTYLLALAWDTPADSALWYKIGTLREDALQVISTDAIEAELRDAKNNSMTISGRYNIGTAYIKDAAAIIGVTDLLLTVNFRDSVPESWGGGYSDFNGQIILNTEKLKIFPIRTNWTRENFPDSVIFGNCFLVRGYGQYALGLFYSDVLPETEFLKGETYISPYGMFLCRNESDPLVLTSVTLKNRECTADITVEENRYTIVFRFTDWPGPETVRDVYSVPEVMTADRWDEITSAFSGKDKKKFSALYTKITPDKLAGRENGDEILACYPAAATETLYILKDDLKASSLSTGEALLKDAGYTAEDYEQDMAQAAVPRETNVVVTESGSSRTAPVRYSFTIPDPAMYPGSDRIQALAGLCEQIGSAVMENRLSTEPMPLTTVIADKYDMGSVDFYVTIDGEERTDSALEISLTVTP